MAAVGSVPRLMVGVRVVRASCLSVVAGVLIAALLAQSAGGAPSRRSRPKRGIPVPRLIWHRCSGVAQPGFQCTTARVPLDYRRPWGKSITLVVIRHRATDPKRRIGTLFYNPGGPVAAKPLLPEVIGGFPKVWLERFDVVTWDLRGLGQSTPVRCFPSQAAEDRFLAGVGKPALSFPVGASQRQSWIRRWAAFGRRCQRRSGDLLRHVSTADSARDMDLLRRAIGQRQLTYVGASYGTFLGATYANLFSNRIRAMVLISALDPAAWVNRGPSTSGGRLQTVRKARRHQQAGASRAAESGVAVGQPRRALDPRLSATLLRVDGRGGKLWIVPWLLVAQFAQDFGSGAASFLGGRG